MKLKTLGSVFALAGALALSAPSYAAFTLIDSQECEGPVFTAADGSVKTNSSFSDCAYEGSASIGKQNVGGSWDSGSYGDLSDRFTFDPISDESITWSYAPEQGDPLIYYVFLKFGNDLYVDGDGTTAIFGGTVSKSSTDPAEQQGISHISFFNGGSYDVPAPAGLGLLGAGLLGLGLMRRKVRA